MSSQSKTVMRLLSGLLALAIAACAGGTQSRLSDLPTPGNWPHASQEGEAQAAERLQESFRLEMAGEALSAVSLLLEPDTEWPAELELHRAIRAWLIARGSSGIAVQIGDDASRLADTVGLDPIARLVWTTIAEGAAPHGDTALVRARRSRSWGTLEALRENGILNYVEPGPWEEAGMLPERLLLPAGQARRRIRLDYGEGAQPTLAWNAALVAESFAHTPRGGRFLMATYCNRPCVVLVDGQEVAHARLEESWGSLQRYIELDLTPGVHRVLIRLASDGSARFGAHLVGLDEHALLASFDATRPEGERGALRHARPLPNATQGPVPGGWFELAERAIWEQDAELIQALAGSSAQTGQGGEESALTHFVRARLYNGNRMLPHHVAVERIRASLTSGIGNWPPEWGLPLHAIRSLSSIYREQGRLDNAWELLGPALQRHPDHAALLLEAAQVADERGWDAIARGYYDRAWRAHPTHCGASSAVLTARLQYGQEIDMDSFREAARICPAFAYRLAEELLLPRGELEQARDLLSDALALEPGDYDYQFLLADLLQMLEGEAAALALLQELEPWTTPNHIVDLWQADQALVRGERDQAAARLATMRRIWQASTQELESQAFISGQPMREGLLTNPTDLIAAWEAAALPWDAPIAHLLDNLQIEVFEDGSSLRLVHQIMQVRTRDALDAGEQEIPPESLLLIARTIKPDGDTFVVAPVDGKDSISYPNLRVGDYIEMAWLVGYSPDSLGQRVFRSPRFFFGATDGPVFSASMELIAPLEWGEPLIDLRGEGVQMESRIEGNRQVFRASLQEIPPVVHVRGFASPAEWLESVRFAWGTGWEELRLRWENLLHPLVTFDENLRVQTLALVKEAETPYEQVRAIFRFASDEIDGWSGTFSTAGVRTFHSREGERAWLLVAMLRSIGLEPEVVFIRPVENDPTPTPIGELSLYDSTAIRVPVGAREVWLDPFEEEQFFDYLPEYLQGADAMVIYGPRAGEGLRTPLWPESRETRHELVRIELDEDGGARVTIRETPQPHFAHEIRRLSRAESEMNDLRNWYEDYVAGVFLAARELVLEVDVPPLDQGDVVVEYSFYLPRFAERTGDRLQFDGRLFAMPLSDIYGGGSAPDLPLIVDFSWRSQLRVEIVPPPGWMPLDPPADAQGSMGVGAWSQQWSTEGQGLRMQRNTSLPLQRIPAAGVRDFRDSLRRYEAEGQLQLVWEKP